MSDEPVEDVDRVESSVLSNKRQGYIRCNFSFVVSFPARYAFLISCSFHEFVEEIFSCFVTRKWKRVSGNRQCFNVVQFIELMTNGSQSFVDDTCKPFKISPWKLSVSCFPSTKFHRRQISRLRLAWFSKSPKHLLCFCGRLTWHFQLRQRTLTWTFRFPTFSSARGFLSQKPFICWRQESSCHSFLICCQLVDVFEIF